MIASLSLIASRALLHRLCRYMLSVVLSLEHRRLVDLRGVLLERFGDAPGPVGSPDPHRHLRNSAGFPSSWSSSSLLASPAMQLYLPQ